MVGTTSSFFFPVYQKKNESKYSRKNEIKTRVMSSKKETLVILSFIRSISKMSENPSSLSYTITELTSRPPSDEDLNEIGRFRYDLWNKETEINQALFPDKCWIEEVDYKAYHWTVRDSLTNELLAVTRLTMHDTIEDNPDGYIWIKEGKSDHLSVPAAHLCKLIVSEKARGCGLGRKLNELTIEKARALGAKCILVTASEANARILEKLGFHDTGIKEIFSNRPKYVFSAMELIL
jgi:ribosomal protein S18 acetylase RimI-like enzyme